MSPFVKGWNKKNKEVKTETKTEETPSAVSLSPIFKAFWIEKDKGFWRLVIADIQDDKVISKKIRECENKAMSLEAFKIAFSETFYFGK